ncbi:MAG: BlaI/MecI/CopY family transcriptional regulator [Acidobacteria bacterium]|nr:BlaI/MecI/CopY family transcriptional regulator [Acidobacteriota bacterium]
MKLTPAEFEIMEIIWEQGSSLVRDVHQELYRRKGLAYTTVMTEMTHLCRKGALSQGKQGRAYRYTPTLTRRQALEGTLEEFVADFFHGSREELRRFVNREQLEAEALPARAEEKTGDPSVQPAPMLPPEEEQQEDVTLL